MNLIILMDPYLQQVLLFVLYILVPLIPAIIIYKLFPDTKASAKGPLKGLTIKTKGAFAAYLIVLLVGAYIVITINNSIKDRMDQILKDVDWNWQVKANLKIIQDSTVLTDEMSRDLLDSVVVSLQPAPNWCSNSEDGYIVLVPNKLIDGNATITYTAPQCETKTICPNAEKYYKNRDDVGKVINLGDIVIRKTTLNPKTYKSADTVAGKTSMQAGPPPKIP